MTEIDPRMAAFDAVMFGVEHDPVLRSTIVALIVLDREPDVEIGTARVERMTRLVPKLRQVVSGTTASLLPPRWETDPNFDLSYHLRRYRVDPEDGSLRPALRIAEQMAEQAFDRNRPLWEMALVTGLAEGRCAVIFKIHHSVTDGVGGMAMAASLFDLTPEAHLPEGPDPDVPTGHSIGAAGRVIEGVQYSAIHTLASLRRYTGEALGLIARVASDPATAATEGAIFAASAARVLAPTGEAMSPVMGPRTLSLEMHLLEVPLVDLKNAGKAVGGTLNDAFMAVVCGALQRYHVRHDNPIPDVRVNMPVNLRHSDEAATGNQWVPARFLIPIDIDDPRERMRTLSPLLRAARTEPALEISDFVMRRLVTLPNTVMTHVAGGLMKGTDVAATNVPGPPFPVYVAGARVQAIVPFAPKAGAAINVALMSYDGKVFLGLNIDTGSIRDPRAMVECFEEALIEVIAVGRDIPTTTSKKAAAKAPAKKKAAVKAKTTVKKPAKRAAKSTAKKKANVS